MSLPVNVSTVTVTGTYLNSNGTPCAGTVEFIPAPCYLNNAGADVTIVGQRVVATLDEDGLVTAELIATDDADLNPSAWTYRVRVRLTDCGTAFSFDMAAPSTAVGYGVGPYGFGPFGGDPTVAPPINLAEQTPVWSG